MKTTFSNSDAAGLSDNDNRPLIKDLLAKHSSAVEGVRNVIQSDENKICKELFNRGDNANRYDDIWILRFVLSYKGNVASASKAALKTIRFRDEKKLNELGDIRHRIRNLGCAADGMSKKGSEPLPLFKLYSSFCAENSTLIMLPDKDRGIIDYVDLGKIDHNLKAKSMSIEEDIDMNMYMKEALLQVSDDVTRRTGRLTKTLQIVDLGNFSFRDLNLVAKREGAVNKALEDYYPQNLGCMLIANCPSWMSTVWFAIRPFFPKRVIEKMDFLPPLSKLKKSKETYLKPITKYVAMEHIPERFGGMSKEWPLPCAGFQFQPTSSSE
mmetsp:Transcript_36747/g.41894  ORF Transcript_36747/g.41894 Transcript_36747/m.41894 type:complete len:325 (-) Transcript_36747:3-977(-)|eukprot:CAMPEP_0194155710 /NCGR_PEP_ID=MMETSP0152-20130528/65628_1 /TAXON_ID=1049557 /ORGANISM="Thalassiothrix antarctica, Strain L6-D1" /LENGTH=324 /DNA_ID=CAMNT_0038862821 /DNA_START=62 /DNA_END=1036 /DNA_ORIENTATION=+